MIYVTVGTQQFQFNRLIKAVDEFASYENNFEIMAQVGCSTYKPQNIKYQDYVTAEEFEEAIKKCSILITHGGTSSIIQGLKYNKKVLAVPRLKEYGEHVDNHQIEIINMFTETGYIEMISDITKLDKMIELALSKDYKKYKFSDGELINSIDEYLTSLL